MGPQWDQSTGHNTDSGVAVLGIGVGLAGAAAADVSLDWLYRIPLLVCLFHLSIASAFDCNHVMTNSCRS